jgi:DNA invertase Pin-like site-specific DNA recombinase
MLVGYARVSTADQDTALQRDALSRAGVLKVFVESGSGVGPRPQLQRALATLQRGSVLVVWKLDRVARSLADLLSILSRLKKVGASIRSLTEPLDTSNPFGEFTFQILGAVAQLERSMIRERVMAGQAAARARGKRWGRRRVLALEDEAQVVSMYVAGSGTMAELADLWGVGLGTIKCAIYRALRPDAPYLTRVRASGSRGETPCS